MATLGKFSVGRITIMAGLAMMLTATSGLQARTKASAPGTLSGIHSQSVKIVPGTPLEQYVENFEFAWIIYRAACPQLADGNPMVVRYSDLRGDFLRLIIVPPPNQTRSAACGCIRRVARHEYCATQSFRSSDAVASLRHAVVSLPPPAPPVPAAPVAPPTGGTVGSVVYTVEVADCRGANGDWILLYEGRLAGANGDAVRMVLQKRYAVRYHPSETGEDSKNWWCIPRRRYCYAPIGFASWGGHYSAGQEIEVPAKTVLVASGSLSATLSPYLRRQCPRER